MSFTAKTNSLQSYHMLVYRNALHPEFFKIEGRRKIEHGGYEFESWIFRGGHAVRFQYDGQCVTEIVTEAMLHLPERGLLATLPCAGEKDHESEIGESIDHVTSIQTETLSDHLYLSTYNEMLDHGRACNGLVSAWTDPSGVGGKPNLSLLDLQRYHGEVHLQSYHLRSDCSLVLRTQTIFQIKEVEEV